MPTGRLSGNITQDWEPVVLRRTKPKASDLKSTKAVNQALRSGAPVETVRKAAAGTNKHSSAAAAASAPARKLDETTEPAAVERVAAEVRAAIQKARVAKGWSQAELAKRINERAQVVQEYDSGKAAPVQAVLAKMERALEVKLRGKAVGAPLAAGGK
ncbi:multiprotein-bridging factor 1c-like [Phragmites australis]|uniref:multiprotein-bridging factor 1c-like n=1 Tax=Phragmites australis TaxID=29695 RepID=UPI002D793322|nr:multiprotein-bridging factor 1c-like [Phragmites australis]